MLASACATQQEQHDQRAAAARSASEPAITTDGHRIEIVANIGGVKEAQQAVESGAEGVGLLHTEFLFPDRTSAPTEDEQFAVYRDVAQIFGSQPMIVRTLDIGGDKTVDYLDLPHEDNPFLGERGVRLCLAHPNSFAISCAQLCGVVVWEAADYVPDDRRSW